MLVGLGSAVCTVYLMRLELRAFHALVARDHLPQIQLGILATFLGFGVAFAVARTLRQLLSKTAYLALSLPLLAAAAAYCALIPIALVWLISQMPP